MKRAMVFSLVGLIILGLAGLSLATNWEVLDVPVGQRGTTTVGTTAGPDHCLTKIESSVRPDGYGVADVIVGTTIVHSQTEPTLDFGTSEERESGGDVDLRSSTTVFRGDAGGNGEGAMSFVLTYPY